MSNVQNANATNIAANVAAAMVKISSRNSKPTKPLINKNGKIAATRTPGRMVCRDSLLGNRAAFYWRGGG